MAEYRIIIKLLDNISSTNDDLFLDEFIQKIEELGLQYGGMYCPEKQKHFGVIDFISEKQHLIEKNINEVQSWLALYRVPTVVLAFFLIHPDCVSPCYNSCPCPKSCTRPNPQVSDAIPGENLEAEQVDDQESD